MYSFSLFNHVCYPDSTVKLRLTRIRKENRGEETEGKQNYVIIFRALYVNYTGYLC